MPDEHADIKRLIEQLSRPEAYVRGVDDVDVHQTHISVVFVAGDRAYKLKKPIELPFVDYSTLEKRKAFCEAEVELNRRLAPSVYRGVVPIVRVDDRLQMNGDPDDGDIVEWAVEMTRLDDADNFKSRLRADGIERAWMEELGRLIAEFHVDAATGPEISKMGTWEVVAKNAMDNFEQSRDQIGETVHEDVFEALRMATQETVRGLAPLIEGRAKRGVPRDCHGDLRLEHVYRVDGELLVIDCIEFNDAFRYADPVSDAAFLVMDLRFRWADRLAGRFEEAYFEELAETELDAAESRQLLPFYVSYRSAVRAKVHGIRATEEEVPEEERRKAHDESQAHWLFAWSVLAPAEKTPCVVLVSGLPATGKSTLARSMSEELDFDVVDSDVVRKELAGIADDEDAASDVDTGIYTAEWTQKTYEACLQRSLDIARSGGRAIVDATFWANEWRERYLRAARDHGLRALILQCDVPREEALRRIDEREGGPSDADREVYEHLAGKWEEPSDFVLNRTRGVDTTERREAFRQAWNHVNAYLS